MGLQSHKPISVEAATMETRNSASAIVRQPGEGARRWFFGGGVHTWKATEEDTAGAFLLFEDEMSVNKVTPLHTHAESDETLYVLSGEILFNMDGTEHRLAAGGVAIAPRGVPHAFKVTQEGTRILCLQTPGVAQAFYDGASEPVGPGPDAGAGGPGGGSRQVDFGRIRESGRLNGGIEIIGPPPFPEP
ncbi:MULTISPECIES: cupin domain-containing protein [Micrococcaceae]|uniref:cupin domain-containing protein n=1 Tax=Micrococcaceae TaxID=1268 RepID=UPI002570AF27|nr:cupin domain-containing protein [Arthrobacter sp. Leaf137]MDQ1055074.1 quercetin dioxygenase-like cupin family protein [Arthrobacter sp. SORGH_AS_0212]